MSREMLDTADVELLDMISREMRSGPAEGYARRLHSLLQRLSPAGLAHFEMQLAKVKVTAAAPTETTDG